jgi:predicted transglutaminase-like cysteine proteinase
VVRDENGEGHAILTARTADGDFILDNRNQDVLIWNRSDYRFVKRQSFHDPQVWVSLTPPGIGQPTQMSGTRSR